jgi:hypothetical protein
MPCQKNNLGALLAVLLLGLAVWAPVAAADWRICDEVRAPSKQAPPHRLLHPALLPPDWQQLCVSKAA